MGEPVCTCGHPESTHFRDTGSCLHSTAQQVWACACLEFQAAR